MGCNDSRVEILSWDRMSPGVSFCPRIKRLQGSHSLLDGTTPGKSFCTGIERLQGSLSIPGQKDSRGVILSQDRRTPG